MSNMARRVLFAVIAIPVAVGIVWLGGWPLAVLLAAAGVLGAREFLDLARVEASVFRGSTWVVAVGIPAVLALALTNQGARNLVDAWWGYLAMGVLLWLLGLAVATRAPDERPLATVSVTFVAMVYTVVLPNALFFIRHAAWSEESWAGVAVTFFPLVIVWVCDSAAMFGGRIVGGKKLAPVVSPSKTVAGGIAGLVGGAVVAALWAAFLFPPAGVSIGVATAAILGIVLAAVGQVGDLAESLVKREAGVKDSSTLIPGHGGVLDRLDSLYFVLPVAAAAYHFLGLY